MRTNVKALRVIACLGLAVSVLGVTGCRSSGSAHTSTQTHADRQLALDVADNLRQAPNTTYPNVAVRAHRGRVELKGYVATDTQKSEAERIASQVPGVRHVDNDLSVQPNSPVGGATTPGGSTQYPEYPPYPR